MRLILVQCIVEISGCSFSPRAPTKGARRALQPLQPQIIDILAASILFLPFPALTPFASSLFPISPSFCFSSSPFARRLRSCILVACNFYPPTSPAFRRASSSNSEKPLSHDDILSLFQTFHETETRISATSFFSPLSFSRLKSS